MRKATTIPVLPIRYRVVTSGIEPDIVTKIAWNVPVGIHGFRLPTSSRDFVIKMMSSIGLDLADMKGRFPIKLERTIRLPLSKSGVTSSNEDRGFWAIDRGDDLKSNLAHACNSKPRESGWQCREGRKARNLCQNSDRRALENRQIVGE